MGVPRHAQRAGTATLRLALALPLDHSVPAPLLNKQGCFHYVLTYIKSSWFSIGLTTIKLVLLLMSYCTFLTFLFHHRLTTNFSGMFFLALIRIFSTFFFVVRKAPERKG